MVRLTTKGSNSQILNYEDTFQVNVNIISQRGRFALVNGQIGATLIEPNQKSFICLVSSEDYYKRPNGVVCEKGYVGVSF